MRVRSSHRLAALGLLAIAAPVAARAQAASPPIQAQADLTPEATIVVGRATGTSVAAVSADIFGAPSYVANYNSVVEGVNLNGVALLQMFSPTNTFLGSCTGSLLYSRMDVLTAGHCVSPTVLGSALGRVDVLFLGPGNVFQSISSTQFHTAAGYDPHFVNNDHDLAMLRLPTVAPSFATGYQLFAGGDPLFQRTLFAGFGLCGNGLTGDAFSCGGNRLAGVNQFDAYSYRCLDANGNETCVGLTTAVTPVLLTDFDNGTTSANTICAILGRCDAGLDREVVTGHGDSGSGNFIEGRLAAVTSWGTGARFGSLQGYVSLEDADNRAFVVSNTAPEPSTIVLVGGGLAGLAAVARRRRRS